MTRPTTRRTSIRQRSSSFATEPTHTALEADEHVFTAYRVVSTPHRHPLWLKHTIRVDPTSGADGELVFTVSERYYDPETSVVQSGIGYEVSRPVRGYRRPLSCREVGQLVRNWYDDAYPSPDDDEREAKQRGHSNVAGRRSDPPRSRVEV